MIPLIKLPLNEDDAQAVADVIRSKRIGLGNLVFEFEKKLAKFAGAKYCVTTDSCTSALFLSLDYFNRITQWKMERQTGVVGVPSMTVPLVANAIEEAGLTCVFTDDVDWVGTHYNLYGTNIWDSAHELYRGCFKQYPKDAVVCLSFYPTKPLGSADGGAILTNDKKMADWLRSASTYGRNQGKRYQDSWDYEVIMMGYKRHYTNLQAALCMSQLERLDITNVNRKIIRNVYNLAFSQDNKSDYLYRLQIKDRDKFIKYMRKNGMACGVHYKPMHMMEAYKDTPVIGSKEKLEEAYKHTVSIPFYADMKGEEVQKVIDFTLKWMYAHNE